MASVQSSSPNIFQNHDLMNYMGRLTQRYYPEAMRNGVDQFCSDFNFSDEVCKLFEAAVPHVRSRPLPGPTIYSPVVTLTDVPNTNFFGGIYSSTSCTSTTNTWLNLIDPRKKVEGFDEPVSISAYTMTLDTVCNATMMDLESASLMMCSSYTFDVYKGFMIDQTPFEVDVQLGRESVVCVKLDDNTAP